MGVTITDGLVRVNAGYSLKLPTSIKFSSEDQHAGVSVEYALPDGAEFEDVKRQAEELQGSLATSCKLMVFAQLGVDFEEAAEGVIKPKLNGAVAQSSNVVPINQAPSGGGNNYPPRGPSKTANMPRINLPDGTVLIDLRPLKADGSYKPTAADFKEADGGRNAKSFWLYQKDGAVNQATAELLASAGIDV